jgi:hypothetical protein
MLRNFSYTITERKEAQESRDLLASLMEVNGDIRRRAKGCLTDER